MKRYLLGGLAAAGLLLGGLALTPGGIAVADQEVCADLDSGKINTSGDPLTVTITAPAGFLIDQYCVKAGSDVSEPDGAVQYVTVSPPVASLVISVASGKSVSHYSYSWIPIPPPPPPPPTTTTTTTTLPPTTTQATTTTTTAPTTTQATTTTTTIASVAPTTASAQAGPVPAASVSPAGAVAAAPTQALPSTGSSSWETAMLALAALLGGLGLVKLSRRSS